MDAWAASTKYGDGKVNFVCVGCAGQDLARRFVTELNLEHCMVGYVKSQRDMPRWGQLGCNGFVVLDSQKQVVSKATSPYLQMKGLAFDHVEALLDSLLMGVPVPRLCPGHCVKVNTPGVSKSKAPRGVVLEPPHATDDQCVVYVLSGRGGGSMEKVSSSTLTLLPPNAFELSQQQLLQVEQARRIQKAQHQTDAEQEQGRKRKAGKAEAAPAAAECSPDANGNGAAETGQPLVHVPSVMNAELDRQHEECAAALESLAKEKTTGALEEALQAIRSHFAYEESLLDQHLYGELNNTGGGGGEEVFSPDASMRKTHYSDHARIVAIMEQELDRLRGEQTSASTCSSAGGCALRVQGACSAEVVEIVVGAFETHADRFDTPYAERLAAALGGQ